MHTGAGRELGGPLTEGRCVRPAGGAYARGLAWGPAAGGRALLFVGSWDGTVDAHTVDLASLSTAPKAPPADESALKRC